MQKHLYFKGNIYGSKEVTIVLKFISIKIENDKNCGQPLRQYASLAQQSKAI